VWPRWGCAPTPGEGPAEKMRKYETSERDSPRPKMGTDRPHASVGALSGEVLGPPGHVLRGLNDGPGAGHELPPAAGVPAHQPRQLGRQQGHLLGDGDDVVAPAGPPLDLAVEVLGSTLQRKK